MKLLVNQTVAPSNVYRGRWSPDLKDEVKHTTFCVWIQIHSPFCDIPTAVEHVAGDDGLMMMVDSSFG